MKKNEYELGSTELSTTETEPTKTTDLPTKTIELPQPGTVPSAVSDDGTAAGKKDARNHCLGSTLWKVLGILALCVLEVLIVVASFVATWATYGDGHPQTSIVRERMEGTTCDIVSELNAGTTTYTDPSHTNLRYLIVQVKKDGTQQVLLDTIGSDAADADAAKADDAATTDAAATGATSPTTAAEDTTTYRTALQKETVWLCFNSESTSPWFTTEQEVKEMSDADWDACSVYRCTVLLVTPFTANDGSSDVYAMGALTDNYGQVALPAIVCLAALFVLVLVYEFCAAGHREGRDGIVLLGIDRFPFDLMTVLMLGLMLFFMPAGFFTLSEVFNTPEYGLQMVTALTAELLAFSLVFFTYLMSLARRVKAGTLWQGTAAGWLWGWAKKAGRFLGSLIPAFWQRMLVLAVSLYIQLDAAARLGRGVGEVYFLAGLAVAAVALHSLWMQRVVCDAAAEICGGNLSYQIPGETLGRMYGAMRTQAGNLNRISAAVSRAVDERMRSERLKTELIANVGHDIRTPLTSITNYVDLLSRDHTPEQEREYLAVLARQTERLRKLTEDVLESSKADSGNIEVQLERTSVAEIVDQAYGEYEARMDAAGLECVIDVPEDLYAMADGRLLWRVLRNLLSNAAKYSAPGSRVYISAGKTDGAAEGATGTPAIGAAAMNAPAIGAAAASALPTDALVTIEIKNVSRERLNISADELMERFVRGDSSRHSEGSGLGLDIARSLSGLMGGRLDLRIDGDLFKASVTLPAA